MATTPLTLINPRSGELAFKVAEGGPANPFDHLSRFNYYTALWVRAGMGTVRADFAEYAFGPEAMLFFSPYQPFMLRPAAGAALRYLVLHFHPDFFCIVRHHAEVACDGVLFNNLYQPPLVHVPPADVPAFEGLAAQLRAEAEQPEVAQHEALVAWLKLWLIRASRLKIAQHPTAEAGAAATAAPGVVHTLRQHIEQHYRRKHAPSDYADLLRLTPKALGRLTKQHLHKTVSQLIQERLVIEAKRELYLTSKPVKEIAYELGFSDEYYFSRLFKNNADVSPQLYRQTVGFARGEA